jgi:hypothetical protein
VLRELVLNEISIPFEHEDEDRAPQSLRALAEVISAAVCAGVVDNSLRMCRPLHELSLVGRLSIFDALIQLLKDPTGVEEARYLMRLSQKCPLLSDVLVEIEGRFHGLDCQSFDQRPDGLLYCLAADGISVSFLSQPIWDAERVTFSANELDAEGGITDSIVSIDNVARPAHVLPISRRNRDQAALEITTRTFWDRRCQVLPHLAIGLDVVDHVHVLDEATFEMVLGRLIELDDAVADWRAERRPFPVWKSHVSPESSSTMNNPRLAAARVFRDQCGHARTFEWHARFGSSGRIHFAMDADQKAIEIGYIGPHLPL